MLKRMVFIIAICAVSVTGFSVEPASTLSNYLKYPDSLGFSVKFGSIYGFCLDYRVRYADWGYSLGIGSPILRIGETSFLPVWLYGDLFRTLAVYQADPNKLEHIFLVAGLKTTTAYIVTNIVYTTNNMNYSVITTQVFDLTLGFGLEAIYFNLLSVGFQFGYEVYYNPAYTIDKAFRIGFFGELAASYHFSIGPTPEEKAKLTNNFKPPRTDLGISLQGLSARYWFDDIGLQIKLMYQPIYQLGPSSDTNQGFLPEIGGTFSILFPFLSGGDKGFYSQLYGFVNMSILEGRYAMNSQWQANEVLINLCAGLGTELLFFEHFSVFIDLGLGTIYSFNKRYSGMSISPDIGLHWRF